MARCIAFSLPLARYRVMLHRTACEREAICMTRLLRRCTQAHGRCTMSWLGSSLRWVPTVHAQNSALRHCVPIRLYSAIFVHECNRLAALCAAWSELSCNRSAYTSCHLDHHQEIYRKWSHCFVSLVGYPAAQRRTCPDAKAIGAQIAQAARAVGARRGNSIVLLSIAVSVNMRQCSAISPRRKCTENVCSSLSDHKPCSWLLVVGVEWQVCIIRCLDTRHSR